MRVAELYDSADDPIWQGSKLTHERGYDLSNQLDLRVDEAESLPPTGLAAEAAANLLIS